MYYLDAIEKTINFIEGNITNSFNLEDLCEINGFSRCHFSKLFHLFTGYGISRYIKLRRLSLASLDIINTSEALMIISIKYQFSSQDSFTRAFTKEYGTSPGKFRKKNKKTILLERLKTESIVNIQCDKEMKPEIKVFENFKLIGLEYYGNNQNNEISELFNQFFKRKSEIENQINSECIYGVCEPQIEVINNIDLDNTNSFSYIAGVEVRDIYDIPLGMKSLVLDHKKYARFTHTGSVENMGETYKLIYSKWLVESGYEAVYAHDFELYDNSFKPGNEKSKVYIYIPIRSVSPAI